MIPSKLYETSLSEMDGLAKELIGLPANWYALTGDLGSGKTTLVKKMCVALGIAEPVSSPTFSLVNIYKSSNNVIAHLDLYRLKDAQEWFDAGLYEVIFDADYVFIEWPEKIMNLLDKNYVLVSISHKSADSRVIEISMISV